MKEEALTRLHDHRDGDLHRRVVNWAEYHVVLEGGHVAQDAAAGGPVAEGAAALHVGLVGAEDDGDIFTSWSAVSCK